MTDKKTYWLVNQAGAKALVEGAEERDRWAVHGWAEGVEPAGDEMVWVQHDETQGRGKLAASILPAWAALGWHPCAPPDPISDVAAAAAEPATEAGPEPQDTPSTPAGRAASKGKESTRE